MSQSLSKTRKQLAAEYGIHITTFDSWVEPIKSLLKPRDKKRKKLYTPREVKMIYDFLGAP